MHLTRALPRAIKHHITALNMPVPLSRLGPVMPVMPVILTSSDRFAATSSIKEEEGV